MREAFTRGFGGAVALAMLLLIGTGLTPSIIGSGSATDVVCTGCVASTDISDGTVALADLANLATDKLIGRVTNSTGVPEAVAFTDAGQAMLAAADAAAQTALLSAATHSTAGILKAREVTHTFLGDVSSTYTNMPSTTAEIYGTTRNRTQFDLTGYTQCRVMIYVFATACNTGGLAATQYSSDGGTNWKWADDGTASSSPIGSHGPQATCDGTTTSLHVGSYVTMTADALADRLWRVVVSGGDGVIDPTLGKVEMGCY